MIVVFEENDSSKLIRRLASWISFQERGTVYKGRIGSYKMAQYVLKNGVRRIKGRAFTHSLYDQ